MWKTRRDFEAELIARAWEDKNFKARLFSDPKSIVEELTGEKLPQTMNVQVFEESSSKVYLVLPKNPDEELSDTELERVAGGVQLSPEEVSRYLDNVFTRL